MRAEHWGREGKIIEECPVDKHLPDVEPGEEPTTGPPKKPWWRGETSGPARLVLPFGRLAGLLHCWPGLSGRGIGMLAVGYGMARTLQTIYIGDNRVT